MGKYVIQTQRGVAPQGAYSQGYRAGDFIFVTGTGPIDAKTGLLTGESIEEQTEQLISSMESVLAADNASLFDVIKVTVHLSAHRALRALQPCIRPPSFPTLPGVYYGRKRLAPVARHVD